MKNKLLKNSALSLLALALLAGCGGTNSSDSSSTSLSSSDTSSSAESSGESSSGESSSGSETSSGTSATSDESSDTSSGESSDDSSEVPPATSYAITSDIDEGATLTIDVTSAKAGETVTFSLEVTDSSKDIGSVKVLAGTSEVSLTRSGNSYSFVMPSSDVCITVRLLSYYSVTSLKLVEPYVTGVSGISEGLSYLGGSSLNVTLSVTYGSYDRFSFGYILNGVTYSLNYSSSRTYTGTITMPEGDAEIIFTHLNQTSSSGCTVTWEESELYDIYGFETGALYDNGQYSYKTFKFVVDKAKSGVYISRVVLIENSSNSREITLSTIDDYTNVYSIGAYNYYNATNFTIKVYAEEVGTASVSFLNAENLVVTGTSSGLEPDATATFVISANDGYYFDGVSSVTTASGSALNSSYYSLSSSDDYSTLTINLRGESVTVTFSVLAAIPVTVVEHEAIASVVLEVGISLFTYQESEAALPGKALRITPTVNEGYQIDKVIINGTTEISNTGSRYFTYDVPSSGVESIIISFSVLTYRSLTYTPVAEAYTFSSTSFYSDTSISVLPGRTISFTLKENAGYKITSVLLTYGETETALEAISLGEYSFAMPDADASIVINYETAETAALTVEKDSGISSVSFTNHYGDAISDLSKINVGETVSVSVTTINGYDLSSVTLNGETLDLTRALSFTMPSADSTIALATTEQAKYAVSVVTDSNISGYTLNDVSGGEITGETLYGYVGHQLTLEATLLSSASTEYKIAADSFTITDANGAEVEFTFASNRITFTMPNSAITIAVASVEIPDVQIRFGENADKFVVVDTSVYNSHSFPTDSSYYLEANSSLREGSSICVYLNDANYDSSQNYYLTITDSTGHKYQDNRRFYGEHDYWYANSISGEYITIDVTIS